MDTGTPTPAELPFGARVRAVFTKYDGRPHWEYDLVVLGVDEYGVWVGGAPGGYIARPGLEFTSDAHWVTLYPHDGMWVATVNDSAGTFSSRVYVDVSTQAAWWHRPDGVLSVNAVDLDLDVILRFTGEVFLDDEDEFDEHREAMNYPADVVAGAREAAAWLYDRLRGGAEPFADVAESWMTLCRERVASDDRGRAVVLPPGVERQESGARAAEPAPDTPRSFDARDGSSDDPEQVAQAGVAPGAADSVEPEEEDLLAVWADEGADRPLVPDLEADDEPAVEVDYEADADSARIGDSDVEWNGVDAGGEGDYLSSGHEVAQDFVDADGIDTSPIDPAEVTGLLLTTDTGRESPLWFDGRPVEPEEVGLPADLADHLRDWADRWNRDFDPVRGWDPRASIDDYEALGRWLGRRVKDAVGGLSVTVQLAHLGRSSLAEIPAASHREPSLVTLDAAAPGDLPVRGDIVTQEGVVGCFSSEVNARLSVWAQEGGVDDAEAEELRWLMSSELGDDYRVT